MREGREGGKGVDREGVDREGGREEKQDNVAYLGICTVEL